MLVADKITMRINLDILTCMCLTCRVTFAKLRSRQTLKLILCMDVVPFLLHQAFQ